MKKKKIVKWILMIGITLGIIGAMSLIMINGHVKNKTGDRIVSVSEAAALEDVDCILVLGCQVRDDGSPSLMLSGRLYKGIELYNVEAAPKLLMSGDHGRTGYDEVGTMKQCAVDSGIPSEDVFMDHAGFSTYESMYRAKEIFQADKVIVVTQEYHLYRALYIAEGLGIEAYGVAADGQNYMGQGMRDIREMLARVKDFATVLFKPEPTYLGEIIPLTGDGNVTNN